MASTRTVINVRTEDDSRVLSVVVPRSYSELASKLQKQFESSDIVQLIRANGTIVNPKDELQFQHKEVVVVKFLPANVKPPVPIVTLQTSKHMQSNSSQIPVRTSMNSDIILSAQHEQDRLIAINVPLVPASHRVALLPERISHDDVSDDSIDESDSEEDESAVLQSFQHCVDEQNAGSIQTVSLHYLLIEPWKHQTRANQARLQQLAITVAASFQGPFQVQPVPNSQLVTLCNAAQLRFRLHRLLLLAQSAESIPQSLPSLDRAQHALIAVFLCAGGYFSAAICQAGQPLIHKSLHRYVVRKQQGGRQVSKDAAVSRSIRSVGSSLRRHHEVRLREEVRGIISAWHSHLSRADLIVVYAPGTVNKQIMFESSQASSLQPHKSAAIADCLDSKDPRVVSCPFVVGRATLQQALSVYRTLCTVQLLDAK
jgi:hypothetical protein